MCEQVSVIVPVYNTEEKLLKNSINSIISQTYKDLQIIMVDDGSCENTASICDDLASLDDRIEIIHTGNRGASNARNIGIENAKGKYCMFVDSDDCIVDDLVEVFVNEISHDGVDCVICGCEQTDDIEKNSTEKKKEYSSKILSKEEMMDALIYIGHPYENVEMTAVWGTFYKTALLKQQMFNTGIVVGEDFLYKFDYFRKIDKLVCVDKTGYIYHLVESGIMRSGFNKRKAESINYFQEIIDKEQQSKWIEGLLSRLVNVAFVILLSIPDDKQYEIYQGEVENFIKKYRKRVLKNKKTRKKVKIAIYISYINFKLVKKVFEAAK